MSFKGVQFVKNCANGPVKSSTVARDFFGLFYRWTTESSCHGRGSNGRLYSTAKDGTQRHTTPRRQTVPRANLPKRAKDEEEIIEVDHDELPGALVRRYKASPAPSIVRYTSTDLRTSPGPKIRRLDAREPISTLATDTMRQLMRSVPHSVVVVTTTAPPSYKNPGNANWKGMTLSSFTTLTLTPYPIVTFNIKRPSQTLDALKGSKSFLVHILEGNESGAELADTFARGNYGKDGQDPFDGLDIERLPCSRSAVGRDSHEVDLPRIKDPAVRAVLHCELIQSHGNGMLNIGDHMICFAAVNRMINVRKQESKDARTIRKARGDTVAGFGLMYVDGKFRTVGDVLRVDKGQGDREREVKSRVNKDTEELVEILEMGEFDGLAS